MESSICAPSDQGQKEAFLNGLSQFLSDKGRYICKEPKLAGRVIDLHDLYNRVTSIGGYQRVTDRGLWEEFLDQYGFPAVSVTLAYGLQKIYQTYLEEYEKVHHFGDDEATPYSRSYVGYRRFRYPISDLQRAQNNMNMEKPLVSDYDRVVLSLESCLPNEIDFAVNACTLLSGESRHVLRLPQCRRIVDALLLHAGIVSDGYDSYKEVLKQLQSKTHHDFVRFWATSITKKSVLPVLLPPTKEEYKQLPAAKESELSSGESVVQSTEQTEETSDKEATFAEKLQRRLTAIQHKMPDGHRQESSPRSTASSKWADLFHGHRLLGVQDYEGQRILQIALVLLNLSFEDFNVVLLARHPSLVRFVFLCIHSRYSCLRQTGLDILSNISSHIQLLDLRYDVAAMLFDTVHTALLSEDKFERIRGFEVLGNICRKHLNADHVCVAVNEDIYEAMVRNLMVHDVELLLSAIEALYRLSKLGETTCTKIIFVRGCIDILICLVTLNVRTFGPEKLSEIRLARRIAPGMQQPNVPQHTYAVPGQVPAMHPSMGVFPRPMHFQHPKLGSVHQARPTFAHAAPSPHTMPGTPTMRPPLPPQPVRPPPPPAPALVPKVQPNPPPLQVVTQTVPVPAASPNISPSKPAQVSNTQTPQPQSVAQVPPTISSPPPTTTTSSNMKSPPGAGAIYTHPEMGTIPPVYHYMPAPPQDIEQDSSPESFTKLWIWATYEFEMESYIPRVEVYCEYLASSNRYGRHGKTEVLSATDFGKCLKAIFPQASSRLFNQGRGQPQYHIAGIKKRATPFPVPGYQLKDPESVFSEYQKIPVTRPTSSVTVQSNSDVKSTAKSTATAQVVPAAADPAISSVPIQQLQFQPVVVVPIAVETTPNTQTSIPQVSSTTEETIPTSSLPNSTPTSAAQAESSAPSSQHHVTATTNALTVQVTPSKSAEPTAVAGTTNSVSHDTASVIGASVTSTPSVNTTVVATTGSLENEPVNPGEDAPSKGGDAAVLPGPPPAEAANSEQTNSSADCSVVTDDSLNCDVPEDCDHSSDVVTKGVKPLAENHKNDGENGGRFHGGDSNHMETCDTTQLNGFPEESSKDIERVHPKSISPQINPPEPMLVETDEASDAATKTMKSKQNPGKNQELDSEPVLNGYDDASKEATATSEQSNGINGKTAHSDAGTNECVVNGEPEAHASNVGVETTTLPACPAPTTPVQCHNTPSSTISVTSTTSITSVECAVTPTNSLPHSALNQRLKDTITRRKNSQLNTPGSSALTGNTTPVNAGLPPSLIQQYSYKQQSKPVPTEEANESTSLAQQIIPVNSSGIPQQYAFHPHPSNPQHKQHITTTLPQSNHSVPVAPTMYAPQVASKRPNPVTPTSAPPAKVLRSSRQAPLTHPIPPPVATRPPYIPVRPQTPVMVQQQMPTHRPSPGPIVRPVHPGTPHHPPPPQGGAKAKPPTIDLMAPNASLLVLYRNVGKIPFANDLDEKEDAISKSIRLTACLILTNVARYSDLGRSLLQRHEGHLASVAMSQMDCSPIVSRLLSEMQL